MLCAVCLRRPLNLRADEQLPQGVIETLLALVSFGFRVHCDGKPPTLCANMSQNVSLAPSIVKHAQRASSVAMERRGRRRAGYRCRSRNGGCCECWNVGRNGRCFGAGNRCCCGRRHKSRYGSRTGCCCGCRDRGWNGGCCRCGNEGWDRCCNRCRNEGRNRRCNRCEDEDRNGCRDRCGNEGRDGCRTRGKDSPNRLGDGENSDKAETRIQRPETRTLSRRRTWDTTARAKSEGRSQRPKVKTGDVE